jgi:outer membrane protein
MKNTLKALLLACISISLLATTTVQAQSKISTIDLKRVFDGYWKTKKADADIKERATEFDKIKAGYVDDYKNANNELTRLLEQANDAAISETEREKLKKDAEAKKLEIREIETNIKQFDESSRSTLASQTLRFRENILREIRDEINIKARAEKYSLVIDIAAQTPNQTPIVLYTNREYDITDYILTRLNANAPASFKNK